MIFAAFILLALAFGSRLFFVIRFGSSTSFLAAMGIGLLGLFSTGVVVPEATLDGLLGGHNVLHLLRNLAVTYAVWLIREGVMKAFGDEAERAKFIYRRRFLAIITVLIVTPFLVQRFVPTTDRFVPENVDQLPVLIYATVYMAALGFLAASVVRTCLKPQASRAVRISARGVAIGMALMTMACIDEIAYMQLEALHAGPAVVRSVLYSAFSPLLYGGVLIVSLSLALPLLIRVIRALDLLNRFTLLVLECSPLMVNDVAQPDKLTRRVEKVWTHKDPSLAVYEHIIRESDRRVSGSDRALPLLTQRTLESAESRFDRSFDMTLKKEDH